MRFRAGIAVALAAMVVTVMPVHTTAAASPGGGRGLDQASERGQERRSERAEAALAAARDLFDRPRDSGDVRARGHASPPPRDVTLVLRDLAVTIDELGPQDRAWAERLLARPTTHVPEPEPGDDLPGKYEPGTDVADTCTDTDLEGAFCLHWVEQAGDVNAPVLTDRSGSGVPDWVETNHRVFGQVWTKVVHELGYRKPLSDESKSHHGPDGRLDIYLADIYPYYGYCTWEPGPDERTAPAYCVVDNDFADFPGDPLDLLKVTAAHEFFHAVQFAYTVHADKWVAEGTAAWVEDEVFDTVNDNLQYLGLSPLRHPEKPLDYAPEGWERFNWRYGSWIWWRFLSEYFGSEGIDDPEVVREVWRRLGVGQRSLPAMRHVLSERRTRFSSVFGDFGAVNRVAKRWYSEGRTYPQAPVTQRFMLSPTRPSTGWHLRTLDHLSTQHVVARPGNALRNGAWRVALVLDLPPKFRGSEANVMVHRRDGRVIWRGVRLDKQGDGRISLPFNGRRISHVALSLTNASTRMVECTTDPARSSPFSCGGRPLDDGLAFRFRLTANR